ncbi:hypothetical protein ACHAQH_000123 [Verticillium albo-atrum]
MASQPLNTELETSRIFVKGIPPAISDADFKKHFSAGGREVTDVKVILPRRIGYVGFKTAEDARKAVRYFNKSYIRMSRIEVQLARPTADPALQKNRKGEQSFDSASSTALPPANAVRDANGDTAAKKRKREDVDESDPKLREYLQTFQPGKTNDMDATMTEVIDSKAIAEKKKLLQDGESDDEYETIPTRPEKKQMKEAPSNEQSEIPRPPPQTAPVEDNEDMVASPQVVESTSDAQAASKPMAAAATDDDWLRSRTNRMLDLVADDEEIPLPAPQKDPREEPVDQPMEDVAAPEDDSQEASSGDSKPQPSEVPAEEAPKAAPAQSDKEVAINTIRQTARLFARNLAFSVSEDDLREHFEQYGEVEEVHIPVAKSGTSKGFAYVSFANADAAVTAFQSSDGQTFQGRLLHVLPAAARRDQDLDEYSLSKLPLKVQQRVRKKAEASTNTFNWNALYMSQDAINTSVASRLGVSKSDLLDPTDASAAVKQAVAETSVIQETKAYFLANGVDLNALKSQKRGDSTILVKNFPHGTTLDELRTLFAEHGTVLRVLMPPSKTIAIVQYAPGQGKAAFGKLAYRRIKDSVLFLEKGPRDLFGSDDAAAQVTPTQGDQPAGVQKLNVTQLLDRDDQEEEVVGQSLFVRNLNFSTTTEGLTNVFKSLEGFVSAKVKTKTDPKKPGQVLSMGFGFVAFRNSEAAQAAIKAMDGQVLDAHTLSVRASHRGQDAAEERRREDKAKKMAGQRTKIVIKNLPFEISKKELRTLFATYGTLRAVRLPKKMGQSTRGFAFAEFSTPKEAQNAIDALQHTHLLGRRLVLDYAEAEAVDAEEEIAKMQKKVGGQVNKVALAQLTGKTRKKITIGEDNEDEFAV